MAKGAVTSQDEQEDSDGEGWLPPLFDDDAKQCQDCQTQQGTRLIHRECGWSVIERPKADGLVARWMVQECSCSLDQTRVELCEGRHGLEFVRDRLCSLFHQAAALLLALAVSERPGPALACMLGGGGLALPMALLASLPDLQAVVVERDPAAIRLARRFFGAECAGRLVIQEADALAFVSDGRLPGGLSSLVVDIDFLRGAPVPPAELASADFWAPVWRALAPGGVVCLNAIGASEEALLSLLEAALRPAGAWAGGQEGPAAAVLEPCGSAERDSWTPFVPRPCTLVLGCREVLAAVEDRQVLPGRLPAATPWALSLAVGVLADLSKGEGLSGRWRWLQAL